jgi:hypothetical protein
MDDSPAPTDKSARPQIIALAIAAAGWNVWLELFYRYSALEKALWLIAAVVAAAWSYRARAWNVRSSVWTVALLVLGTVLATRYIGFPFQAPFMTLALGTLLCRVQRYWRVKAIGSALVIFALLFALQALIVPQAIWITGITYRLDAVTTLLAKLWRAIGVDASAYNGDVVLANSHFRWRFAPTFSLLACAPVVAFSSSGTILVVCTRGAKRALAFLTVSLVILPIFRYMVLSLAYLQWETIDWFFSPVVTLAFLLPAVAIATGRSAGAPKRQWTLELAPKPAGIGRRAGALSFALVAAAVFFGGFAALLPDPGARKPGRVLIDEAHGGWEWTNESFTTDWYGGAATYNYWNSFDYISAHYPVRRNYEPITTATLRDVDVLVVKTPSKPFSAGELIAIERWVGNGGGLYLIGDHTNVFGMTTCLNPLARQFGLKFEYDATYDLEKGGLQTGDIPSVLRHPILSGMPNDQFLWGTSCSLTADTDIEPVLIGTHVRARYLDYGRRSFFAVAYLLPQERFGPILQSGAIRHGAGRVAVWSDSTVFSNFWAFFPGKAEMFLGSISWLNHKNTSRLVSWAALGASLSCLVLAMVLLGRIRLCLGQLLISLAIGVPLAIGARDALAHVWYQLPRPALPLRTLVFDRAYSDINLPEFTMQGTSSESFQTFYTWTQRLDIVPRCVYSFDRSTAQPEGRMILIRPNRELTPQDLRRLDGFFERGGRLLVIDGPSNPQSTVNLLLERHGLIIDYRPASGGIVHSAGAAQPPLGLVQPALSVEGGEAVVLAGDTPIIARKKVKNGELWACGLADVWSEASLGSGNAPVTLQQKFWSELEYWTIEQFMRADSTH